MIETTSTTKAPSCPGCHFGCALDAYRCGRGKGFHQLWVDGKPIPERGKPGEGGAGRAPSVDTRVMHGLNIMANILKDRHTESAERKTLMAVGRQGGFFAVDMLGKRTLLDPEDLAEATRFLIAGGFIEHDEDEIAGTVLRITSSGREQLAQWNTEREAATEEFLAPLDDSEKEQLASMLFRIIQSELQKKRS